MGHHIGSERKSADQCAFNHYLRTGQRLTALEWTTAIGRKFNPNHDPENGQFTFGEGTSGALARTREMVSRVEARPASRGAIEPPPLRTPKAPTKPEHIRAIMPTSGKRADNFAEPLDIAMASHGIDSPEQRAAFLAQVSVESGELRATSENLDYSAKRLTEVWPQRFPTIASAQPYAHNPEALANHVYANRMGNGNEASGDGFAYRGRGLMQVTGRANYRRLGYEKNPDVLADPVAAAASAASYWQTNGLHDMTRTELNRVQFDAISRRVNGGSHGSNQRWAAYQRALAALKAKVPGK